MVAGFIFSVIRTGQNNVFFLNVADHEKMCGTDEIGGRCGASHVTQL